MSKHLITAKVYDRRGTLIGQANNSYTKTHPLMAYFGKQVGMPQRPYLHAEIAALLKCGPNKPFSISVERFKKDGSPGLARPCAICERALKVFGVQRITYTVG